MLEFEQIRKSFNDKQPSTFESKDRLRESIVFFIFVQFPAQIMPNKRSASSISVWRPWEILDPPLLTNVLFLLSQQYLTSFTSKDDSANNPREKAFQFSNVNLAICKSGTFFIKKIFFFATR